MSMKSKLGMLSLIAAMMDGGYAQNSNHLTPKDIDVTPKDKPVPKGCKRYYYNKYGLCGQSDSEIYFDALKPSTAHKKYQRWLEIQ